MHAFIFSGGQFQDLHIAGAHWSAAVAINERNQIVIEAEMPEDTMRHLFLWEDGLAVELSVDFDFTNFSINDSGDLTYDRSVDSYMETWPSIWREASQRCLSEWIPLGSPWRFRSVRDINNKGWIAVNGRYHEHSHGLLLIPVDAPVPDPTQTPTGGMREDINLDGSVDHLDLMRLMGRWHQRYQPVR